MKKIIIIYRIFFWNCKNYKKASNLSDTNINQILKYYNINFNMKLEIKKHIL